MKKTDLFFLAGALVGSLSILFFAKESGKSFREKLEKSKTPVQDFFREILEIKLDTLRWIEEKGREFLKK